MIGRHAQRCAARFALRQALDEPGQHGAHATRIGAGFGDQQHRIVCCSLEGVGHVAMALWNRHGNTSQKRHTPSHLGAFSGSTQHLRPLKELFCGRRPIDAFSERWDDRCPLVKAGVVIGTG